MRRSTTFAAIALCCAAVISPAQQTPVQQTNDPPPQDSTYTFKSNVNVVLVPVLVRDKQGLAIGNLKKEDFQVFDNDKPQVISGFTIQTRTGIESATNPTQPAPAVPAPQPPPAPERFIVFLFDDMHLSLGDLAQAQKAGTKILAASLTETDVAAVVSLSGRINSGLTADRAQLQAAIMKLQPQNLYRTTGSECPPMDYYHADLIENKHNTNALEAAIQEVMSCSPGVQLRTVAERLAEAAAIQALAVGEQDVQVALASVKDYVRRMATLPGQRTLILVSPGFLPLTERGGGSSFSTRLKSEYRRNSMSLNENVMAELAAGTGGTYFHNSNDLEGGFRRLTAAPEYLYLLEFSAGNVKQNGSYHRLKVKIDQEGLTLQSRKGYFAPKPPRKKK